jgi:hypothetical protein
MILTRFSHAICSSPQNGLFTPPFLIGKMSKHEDHIFKAVSGDETEPSTVGFFLDCLHSGLLFLK